MLRRVGFPDPKHAIRCSPFELSGGLRQRAMIAMALICRPAMLIADEPTTALDVTIQAQILKLMKDLQAEFGMAILFISHDLGVVANIADEIVVLYRGQVMERGTCERAAEPGGASLPQGAAERRAAAAYPCRRSAWRSIREVTVDAGLTLHRDAARQRRRVATTATILEVDGPAQGVPHPQGRLVRRRGARGDRGRRYRLRGRARRDAWRSSARADPARPRSAR